MRGNFFGKIKSAFLCQPLKSVKVTAYSLNNTILERTTSNKRGEWEFQSNEEVYTVSFSKEGYTSKTIIVNDSLPEVIRLLEDKIIGYQDKLWFIPGDQISAYILSSTAFQAQLLRHGIKTEKVMDLGEHQASIQNVPDSYFVEEGLKWESTFSYKLPENTLPGIYSLEVISCDQPNNKYRVSFLVSTKKENYGKNSKLLVLASTNNWQTYNVWGGRSRYRNFEISNTMSFKALLYMWGVKTIPETARARIKKMAQKHMVVTEQDHPEAWQFKKLSIKRPHPNAMIIDDNPITPFTSHLAAGEWRLLAWLERENIAYDIVSGYELHNNPDLLSNYKAFILSTHSEYWSKEMFNGLKKFNSSGGAILNLSGNSIYREIEFKDKENIRCISLRFEKSAEDESKTIAVRFDMRGYGTCAPYKVLIPDHWIFENTGVEYGSHFAKSSLNKPFGQNEGDDFNPSIPGMRTALRGDGGSGWETDKITSAAPSDTIVLAKGDNPKNGGADMIIRENSDAGLLFSASSITFGGALLIDETSSKIILNILNKVLHNNDKKEKVVSKNLVQV